MTVVLWCGRGASVFCALKWAPWRRDTDRNLRTSPTCACCCCCLPLLLQVGRSGGDFNAAKPAGGFRQRPPRV